MNRYVDVDDLKDRILLAAMDRRNMSIKEIYNIVNSMPTVIMLQEGGGKNGAD